MMRETWEETILNKRQWPNVLFLMSDEHRFDASGFAGDSVAKTPTLDWLARTGVVFENAYTPSPICIPSRQCMMSGQLPKTAGCEGWVDLKPMHMTFARRFAQVGYQTACMGKLHHVGADPMQGWQVRLAGDVGVGRDSIGPVEEPWFTQNTRSPVRVKWSDAKEIMRAGPGKSPYDVQDELAVLAAEHFIKDLHFGSAAYDRAQPERPLMLKVSLLAPHYPYFCDEERFLYYLNRVKVREEAPEFEHGALQRHRVKAGQDVSRREAQRATAAYYGMIQGLDQRFARVINALETMGENLDEWIIVYTSDHGEMLGQHGCWEKGSFYEGSVRSPLIIRWPEKFAARRVDANVSLCDLFATLCDLAGLALPQTPRGLDSRSLAPLMRGERKDWDARYKNEVVSQFHKQEVMIKRDALKYMWFGGVQEEVLFDLEADPGETRNVIGEAKYAAKVEEFRGRLRELGHGEGAEDYVNAGYER